MHYSELLQLQTEELQPNPESVPFAQRDALCVIYCWRNWLRIKKEDEKVKSRETNIFASEAKQYLNKSLVPLALRDNVQ